MIGTDIILETIRQYTVANIIVLVNVLTSGVVERVRGYTTYTHFSVFLQVRILIE